MANQTGSRRRQGIPFYRLDRKLSKYIHDFLSKSEQSLKMAPNINHYETTLNCQLFIQNCPHTVRKDKAVPLHLFMKQCDASHTKTFPQFAQQPTQRNHPVTKVCGWKDRLFLLGVCANWKGIQVSKNHIGNTTDF